MAAVAMGGELETIAVAPARPKLSWGSIFGGMFVALGVWIMLLTLGLAIGLGAVDPNDLQSAKQAATGTGIWSVVALLLSLLAGGLVAARTAGIVDRGTGALHGAVLWGFTTLAGVLIMGFALRAGIVTAANLGGQAVGGAASAVAGVAREGDTLTQSLGISGDDLVAPINRRLRAEGKPPVSAAQVEAAARSSVSTGLREGRLDKQVLVSSIASQTNLSQADARDIADRIETSFNQRKSEVSAKIEHAVGSAVDTTKTAMWWTFITQLIGLGAAMIGATVGVSRKQRRAATYAVGEQVLPPAMPPIATTREAHSHT